MADQVEVEAAPANNDVFILPDNVFGPPDYAPVSFENLEQDTIYLVRMTTHDLDFADLVLQTTNAVNWRTADTVRPKLMAIRKFKRMCNIEKMLEEDILIPDDEEAVEDADGDVPLHVADVAQHEGEAVTMDEFDAIMRGHGKAEEVFKQLPYATDANGMMIPGNWDIFDELLTYPVGSEFMKMEISADEYGYVFFKKQQAGGRRKQRRHRSTRRGTSRRRRSTRRLRR